METSPSFCGSLALTTIDQSQPSLPLQPISELFYAAENHFNGVLFPMWDERSVMERRRILEQAQAWWKTVPPHGKHTEA